MKKQNQYFVEEREIDVIRMFLNALSYWRFILIAAAVGAVFMGVKQYRDDVRAAKASIQAQIDAANAPEVTIESLKSQMTAEMVQSVKIAFQYMEAGEQRQEYMENSIYMNLDAYEEHVVYLSYSVEGEGAKRLLERMKNYIQSSDMAADVAEDFDPELEEQYIRELYSVKETDNASYLTVKALGDTEEECARFADSVERVLDSFLKGLLAGNGEASVALTDRLSDIVVDNTLVAQKRSYIADLNNDNNTFKSYYVTFSDAQCLLLDKMIEEREMEQEGFGGAASNQKEEALSSIDTAIHVRPSIKIMLAGFFAGAVLAFAFRALLYTISKGIHGGDEVKYLFGIPVFGAVNTSSVGRKRPFAAVDTAIDKLGSGRHKYLNYEQQLQMIYSNIMLSCRKKEIGQVYLSGSEIEHVPPAVLEALAKKLECAGILAVCGGSIAYDADSMVKMAEIGACVLVEIAEKTKCEEIAKELNLCMQNQIEVLGMLLAYPT